MEQSVVFEWNQDASDGVTEVLVEVVGNASSRGLGCVRIGFFNGERDRLLSGSQLSSFALAHHYSQFSDSSAFLHLRHFFLVVFLEQSLQSISKQEHERKQAFDGDQGCNRSDGERDQVVRHGTKPPFENAGLCSSGHDGFGRIPRCW